MENGENRLVLDLITAGVRAGRYRAAIREDRALAGGFGKLAAKHHAAGTALMREFLEGRGAAARMGLEAAPAFTTPWRRWA